MNINQINEEIVKLDSTELVSDGFHTFKELYDFRLVYNAAWFNLLQNQKIEVYKSKKHLDGQLCFGGGWFIVIANLPNGQISNHYSLEFWDYFKIPEVHIPDEYDGHTSQDVLKRIKQFILRE